MATILKKAGKHVCQIAKKDPHSGEKIRIAKTFRLLSAAQKWARQTETQIEQGTYKPPSADRRTTLADLLDRYEKEIAPSLKGLDEIVSRISWWKKQPLSKKSVYDLKSSDFHAHRRAREKAGRASSTIRNEMNLIARVYNVAQAEWSGFADLENPLKGVKKTRTGGMPEGRNRRLSYPPPHDQQDEEQLILERADELTRVIFIIAVETAMRRGEILSLRWSMIHPAHGGVVAILPDTKNSTSRTVPLSRRAQEALSTLKNRKKTDALFPELTEGALTKRWAWLTEKKCGITDLHFHDLRHEATSRLVASGMRLDEVKLITGHKSLDLLSRYTHPKIEDVMKHFISE
jgi:integrase